jgi:DivIVA domain-containing protein
MIDLTPLDVRKKRGDFRRILRGYDPEEVDTFMDLVADRFEELVRENLHLAEKAESIGSQLEALVGREKAVQEALVSAQKLREDLKAQSQQDAETLKGQAEREAELLKAEAEAEIQRRLVEVEGMVRERQRAMEELERSRLKFLKSFRGLLERELDAVEVEEARRPLEETPLELEFRGRALSGKVDAPIPQEEEQEVVAEGELEEEEEADAETAPGGGEPVPMADLAPDEDTWAAVSQILETPLEVEVEDPAAVDAPDEAEASGQVEGEVPDQEDDDDAPGGFETQVLEGAIPVGIEELAPAVEEADLEATDAPDQAGGESRDAEDAEGVPGEDGSEKPEEPKWLYSLLKKEEEKEADG